MEENSGTTRPATPRWISDAHQATCIAVGRIADSEDAALAQELLGRLPIEAMVSAATRALNTTGGLDDTSASLGAAIAVTAIVETLGGEHEVVEIAEHYLDARAVLDAVGVPYGDTNGHFRGIADRIRWLAAQRPTRTDLDNAVGERDEAKRVIDEMAAQLVAARNRVDELTEQLATERDFAALYDEQLNVATTRGARIAELEREAIERADAFNQSIADASIERDRMSADFERRIAALRDDALIHAKAVNDAQNELSRLVVDIADRSAQVANLESALITTADLLSDRAAQLESYENEIAELESELYDDDGDEP